MGKFLVKKTDTGIKFDLKAVNGETIASSEVYNSEASCKERRSSRRYLLRSSPVCGDRTCKAS